MKELVLVSARTEEVPHFFDFKKWEIVGQDPMMANLTYDPFPNAKDDDVVRTEIIARKLILHAELKGATGTVDMGMPLDYQGHRFEVDSIEEDIDTTTDTSDFQVVGIAWLSKPEPLRVLATLRRSLAASNSTSKP